jgi:hypothetical protein
MPIPLALFHPEQQKEKHVSGTRISLNDYQHVDFISTGNKCIMDRMYVHFSLSFHLQKILNTNVKIGTGGVGLY